MITGYLRNYLLSSVITLWIAYSKCQLCRNLTAKPPDFSLVFILQMNTQDTARSFWINFISISLSCIGSLRYVPRLSTDWRCFLKYFLKLNLLWWVFMCWIYLDGRWRTMNARSPGNSFSYHFFPSHAFASSDRVCSKFKSPPITIFIVYDHSIAD